jgi:hypothetical protein
VTIIKNIKSFEANGYRAKRVESAVTGNLVWHVDSPKGVRLRGDFETADEALAAIDDHQYKPWDQSVPEEVTADDKTWRLLSDDEFGELLGESVHTGLRKGVDGKGSADAWQAIRRMSDGGWGEAIGWAVGCLRYMGYRLAEPEENPS